MEPVQFQLPPTKHRIVKKMLRYVIVIVLINSVCANSLYPSQISRSSTTLDKHQQNKNGENYNEESKKDVQSTQSSTGYNSKEEKNKIVGQDSGNYSQENSQKNNHQNSAEKQGQNFHQQNFDSLNKFGRRGGHKKGHHKSGYSTSYHKDESENNSSYFDDSDDEGGHIVYDSRNNAGSQNSADRFRNSYDRGQIDNRQNNRKGFYDVGRIYDNQQADRNSYNDRQYYNDRKDKSHSNIDNNRGEVDRNYEERIYRNPYYPRYNRYEPRKTITIYEDPRVFDKAYPELFQRSLPYDKRYDSDFIQLDFRRPVPYERRPFYDFYQ